VHGLTPPTVMASQYSSYSDPGVADCGGGRAGKKPMFLEKVFSFFFKLKYLKSPKFSFFRYFIFGEIQITFNVIF